MILANKNPPVDSLKKLLPIRKPVALTDKIEHLTAMSKAAEQSGSKNGNMRLTF